MLVPACLAAGVSVFAHRISGGVGGNLHDGLHIVWRLQDPELFSNDPVEEYFRRQPTLWWQLLAWLIPVGSDGAALFSWGPVVILFCFSLGMGFLARGFSREPAVWAAAILVSAGLGDPLIGSNYLMSNQLSFTVVVVPGLLVALGLGASGRSIAALAAVGLLANLHVLNSLYVGVSVVAGLAMSAREGRDWRRLAIGCGVAAVLAFPTLWLAIRYSSPMKEGPEWAQFAHASHSIHYYPFRQYWALSVKALSVIVLLGGVCVRLLRSAPRTARYLLGVVAANVGVFLIFGTIASDVWNWGPAIRLQPLRAAAWLMPLAVVAVAKMGLEVGEAGSGDWEGGRDAKDAARPLVRRQGQGALRRAWIASLVCLSLLNLLRPYQSLFGQVFSLCLACCAALSLWPSRVEGAPARLVAAFCGGIAVFIPVYIVLVLACIPYSEEWHQLDAFARPLVVFVLLMLSSMAVYLRDRMREERATGGVRLRWPGEAAALLLYLGIVLSSGVSALALDRVRDDAPMWKTVPEDRDWQEAGHWLRDHTPKDAVVQGPPNRAGLRTYSQRSVVYEVDDDAAIYCDPSVVPLLVERSQMFKVPLTKTYYGKEVWNPATVDWNEIQRRYDLRYVVLLRNAPPVGTLVHENGKYCIYRL